MFGREAVYAYYCVLAGIIATIWWFMTDKNFETRYKKK
jgi:hypothetical protein